MKTSVIARIGIYQIIPNITLSLKKNDSNPKLTHLLGLRNVMLAVTHLVTMDLYCCGEVELERLN
jgi:hypothetical protein